MRTQEPYRHLCFPTQSIEYEFQIAKQNDYTLPLEFKTYRITYTIIQVGDILAVCGKSVGSGLEGSRLAPLKRRGGLVQGWRQVELVFSINCEPGTVNPEPL